MKHRPRRLLLLILAVVLLVGITAAVFLREREREPEYGGKKLSEWMRDYAFPRSYWIPAGLVTTNLFLVTPTAFSHDAAQGVGAIGTNAIPFLVKWMRYDQPMWKAKACAALNPLLKRINGSWKLTDERERLAAASAIVLDTFRNDPGPAIPGLALIMNDRNSVASKRRAQRALEYLGGEGYRVLLTNGSPRVRLETLRLLARRGMIEEASLPLVMRRLQDPEPDVAAAAAETLGRTALHAPSVVPVLTKSLQDPRREVRLAAAEALGGYYRKAASAAPDLRPLLGDADPRIREAAARALKHVTLAADTP